MTIPYKIPKSTLMSLIIRSYCRNLRAFETHSTSKGCISVFCERNRAKIGRVAK